MAACSPNWTFSETCQERSALNSSYQHVGKRDAELARIQGIDWNKLSREVKEIRDCRIVDVVALGAAPALKPKK